MKLKIRILVVILFCSGYAIANVPAKIYNYPLPSIYAPSSVFLLQVNSINIPVVNYDPKYDYANFSMSKGTAQVTITILQNKNVSAYIISPKKFQIIGTMKGRQLSFLLKKDDYLIVKINQLKELVITADAEEKDKPKAYGKNIFNVTSPIYNASTSGKMLATAAFQKAVDDASSYHNGIVYVPSGVYALGNLQLRSNMALYLEGGAVLLFTGHPADYKVNARKISQNRNITWWIYTNKGTHDVKIYGRGTLDGNGKYATSKENNIGNNILAIMKSQHFVFDGPIIKESGAWAVIPSRSKDMVFKNMKIFNRLDMGENDGIDVMESENVLVKHAIAISLDDPFSTKTWEQNTDLCRNWPGTAQPQHNIVFDDLLSWTYCYAYKIGQGVTQPQTDITFKNCVVYDAAVGIGIHHKWGASYVKNVVFDHIEIEKLTYKNDDNQVWGAFFMQNGDKKGSGPVSDISIKNINIYDLGKSYGKIKGISASALISNVTFKNIYIEALKRQAVNLMEINMMDTVNCRNIKVIP